MCGIIGILAKTDVASMLYEGLLVLQHRGQDAAGIVTMDNKIFRMKKEKGLVQDVFTESAMRLLTGHSGIGHVRYPTAGGDSSEEAQPFYVNSPFGLVLAHNGNLTNADILQDTLFHEDLRHINTTSDSEILLNVFAHELFQKANRGQLKPDTIFEAVSNVHRICHGAYAAVLLIAGHGLLAFRDPYGIRPLIYGERLPGEVIFASESVALDVLGFRHTRDLLPGEAIFVDLEGNIHQKVCSEATIHAPCMFEYVYFARPDSIIEGVSVYAARMAMGEKLAQKIQRDFAHLALDVIVPIPDTSRASALELSRCLNVPYREGLVKNRYIGRTFIMPGQAKRQKSVRRKLNPIASAFAGKNVLLVDDSIVRGNTSRQIVQLVREAGANEVYFASASPPVRFPNVYGIDMPSRKELLATDKSDAEIAEAIGADAVIYQDLPDLIESVRRFHPALSSFETSCFDGHYITGDVSEHYLKKVESIRNDTERLKRMHNEVLV
jgi:amidophosphoribosyltransferase